MQAWGISVLNPNKTKVLGDCEGASPHLPLFFPYGQLTFGFKRVCGLTVSTLHPPVPHTYTPEPASLLCGHGCPCCRAFLSTSRTRSRAREQSTSATWQWSTTCPSHGQRVSSPPFSLPTGCPSGEGRLRSWLCSGFDSSLPTSSEWAFSAQNSSLRALQAPLGQSFCCRNTSIAVSPTVHLDLLSLRMQAAQLPDSGRFGPCKPSLPPPPGKSPTAMETSPHSCLFKPVSSLRHLFPFTYCSELWG